MRQKLVTAVHTDPARCVVERSVGIASPRCRKLLVASRARVPGRRASGLRSNASGDSPEQDRRCTPSAPSGLQDELPPPQGGGPVALRDAPDKHVGRGTPKGRPATKLRQGSPVSRRDRRPTERCCRRSSILSRPHRGPLEACERMLRAAQDIQTGGRLLHLPAGGWQPEVFLHISPG